MFGHFSVHIFFKLIFRKCLRQTKTHLMKESTILFEYGSSIIMHHSLSALAFIPAIIVLSVFSLVTYSFAKQESEHEKQVRRWYEGKYIKKRKKLSRVHPIQEVRNLLYQRRRKTKLGMLTASG